MLGDRARKAGQLYRCGLTLSIDIDVQRLYIRHMFEGRKICPHCSTYGNRAYAYMLSKPFKALIMCDKYRERNP